MLVADARILGTSPRSAFRSAAFGSFVLYFLATVGLGLLSSLNETQPAWNLTLADAARFFATHGISDANSFASGAFDVARNGWFTPPNYWLIHLWPPGFMLLEGGLLLLFGETMPILPALLVLAALCCAMWMTLLRLLLLPALAPRLATLVPFAPFLFPLSSFFLLTPVGLSLGESFSISLFLSGFLLVLLAFRQASWRQWGLAALAGLALAASAYFRSQFELLVVFLSLCAVVLFVFAGLVEQPGRRMVVAWPTLRVAFIALLVANAAMAPWRYYNYLDLSSASWVQTSTIIARNSMTSEKELLAAGGGFVTEGGGHLACKLEPSTCGKTDPALFYGAFFHHAGAWTLEKLRRLPAYWMAPPDARSLSSVRVQTGFMQGLANLVLLACLVACAWRLWRIRSRPEFFLQAWFQVSFYGALAAVYLLAHLEARYFYLPKIFSVVALITLWAPRSLFEQRKASS